MLQDLEISTDLETLGLFLLRTRDAHDLYAQFGFHVLAQPEEMMVLKRQEQ
jgi:hypothetical protein